jgi:hypothetical protein
MDAGPRTGEILSPLVIEETILTPLVDTFENEIDPGANDLANHLPFRNEGSS